MECQSRRTFGDRVRRLGPHRTVQLEREGRRRANQSSHVGSLPIACRMVLHAHVGCGGYGRPQRWEHALPGDREQAIVRQHGRGLAAGSASLLVGASTTSNLSESASSVVGGFATARFVRIARIGRIDASGAYSRATYLDMTSGSAGPGVTLFGDALDLSAYYRSTTIRYRALSSSVAQHAVGGTMTIVPGSPLLLAVQGEAILGDDTKALILFGTVTWHPRL